MTYASMQGLSFTVDKDIDKRTCLIGIKSKAIASRDIFMIIYIIQNLMCCKTIKKHNKNKRIMNKANACLA